MTSETVHTSAGPRPSALPAEPNLFVGRERDLADLRRLLLETRAVTLCGPGGIGKTRLAVRVARSLAGEHADGVWFVELADVTAGPSGLDEVARRVQAACGLADEPGRTPLDALTDTLRRRRALVVLDNCEHLVDECAGLCRVLLARCERLRILATSREPLRVPGENVWRVPPLSVPPARGLDVHTAPERHESVRLFVARATAARPDFALTPDNASALAELCRALDGVPLALELAAARVRVLSLEQIADRLTDRFRLLTAGDRTAPPRQRTLRGAIDWSHELLEEPERILLRRLSVFRGWCLDQAERVCADELLPQETILDLLAALVDKSLVVVDREVAGQSRFRLLDSIREYAAQRLDEAGETGELRRRHRDTVLDELERFAEICVGLRETSWRRRVELFRRQDVEQHNLRAALAWSREQGDIDEGLRLCVAARHFWGPHGYYTEAAEWNDWFLERGDTACAHILGPALVGRAQLAIDQRDFAGAKRWARAGVELCRENGNGRMLAAGLGALVHVAMHEGDEGGAQALSDEAMAVTRAEGDRWNEALCLIGKGMVRLRPGRLREAEGPLREGVALMRDLDQLWGAALGQVLLGMVARERGDLAGAWRYFEEALPALCEIDARPMIIRCRKGMGRCALARGDLAEARRIFSESLRLAVSIGLRIAVARCLEAFTELLAREGDERGALLLAGAAAALRDEIGAPPGRASGGGTRLEGILEQARRRLGEQRVAQSWGEGRAMSVDDAVAYALYGPPDRDGPAADDQDQVSGGAAGRGPGGAAGPESGGVLDGVPDRASGDAPGRARAPARGGAADHAPGDARGTGAVSAAGRMSAASARVPAAPVTPPSMLTPREREIAQMIARGLSNRGIADELVISPATVARHVTNILTKLGFGSRAQIAAWAVDNIAGGE